MAVDVAPEIKWNPENGYKNLKVTVECEADDALAAQKAADAELLSRLKDLGSLRVVIGRGLEVSVIRVATSILHVPDDRIPFGISSSSSD